MKTALVLCGGSAHGAIEVGLYQALEELKIPFDFVVGTSIGAINGAMIAAGMSAAELAECWQKLKTRDVLEFSYWWWKVLFNKAAISNGKRLENFIRRSLPVQRFEQLHTELVVVATDLERNETVLLREGDLADALMASSALPGILPPRRLHGRWLVDGAVTANMPVLIARDLGAERIITFPCRCLGDWKKTPVGLMNVLLKSLTILIDTQESCHLKLVEQETETLLVEACPGERLGTMDFDNAHRLIEPAYQRARQRLMELMPG